MKKRILLLVLVIGFQFTGWSQPDYSEITFKSRIKEYKKSKPNIKDTQINRELIKEIVTLLGGSFYSSTEIDDISEKAWLSLIDPKKFDFVYKDIAIRTIPNWSKKNFKGLIVLEPNPFLKEWTLADTELAYFHEAFSKILGFYGLMGYAEDAKNTKRALSKILYTKKTTFKTPSRDDWTNSYLKAAEARMSSKDLRIMVKNAGYNFFVCKNGQVDELTALFAKMDWAFIHPEN